MNKSSQTKVFYNKVTTHDVGFENPSRNKSNVYVEPEVKQAVSQDSRMFEELKFEDKNVLQVIGPPTPLDPAEILGDNQTRLFSANENQFPEVESFTATEVLHRNIEESEVTQIEWGFSENQEGELVPASGPITVETRSARGENAYQLWIPYVDSSRGVIAGFVEPPYSAPETFSYSRGSLFEPDADFLEEEVLDLAYQAAQELVPEVKPDYTENYGEQYFESALFSMGMVEPLRRLESEGEIKIGCYTHLGTARGRDAALELKDFLNKAKERRIIDYPVEIEDKDNNALRTMYNPYKTVTQDADYFDGYDGPMDVVGSRLTQG